MMYFSWSRNEVKFSDMVDVMVYEIVDMIAKTLGSSLTRVYVYCLHFN